MNTIVEKGIETLELNKTITNKLISNKRLSVKDLWEKRRTDLKKMGFSDREINQIVIKL